MNRFPGKVVGIGAMAIMLAAQSSCKRPGETVKSDLHEAGYKLTTEDWFRASRENDVAVLKKFVAAGFKPDSLDGAGDSALHAAASTGSQEAGDFLLDKGLSVDLVGEGGRTPLMVAVTSKQREMVRWLLQQGADPKLKDAQGFKPLMLAVKEGNAGAVEELAAYDRGELDHAILLAALVGRADVIDSLTNFGASVYARMDDGRTPLMIAAENGHEESVKLLLDIGASRFMTDPEGRTAADLATEAGHTEIAALLSREPLPQELALESPSQVADQMDSFVDSAVAKSSSGNSSPGGGAAKGTELVGNRPKSKSIEGQVLSPPVAVNDSPVRNPARQGSRPEPIEAGFPIPPLVMRHYREKVIPLSVESVRGDSATVSLAGRSSREVQVREGEKIPGSNLIVVRMQKKQVASKVSLGRMEDIAVVDIRDEKTGTTREWISGVQSSAHEPVALVEDSATGQRYLASPGQHFKGADGTEYFVSDVRPNQMVIREVATGEVRTIPLRGPRG